MTTHQERNGQGRGGAGRGGQGMRAVLWLALLLPAVAACASACASKPAAAPAGTLWQRELKDYWFGHAPVAAGPSRHAPLILARDPSRVWAVDPASGQVAWQAERVAVVLGGDGADGPLWAVMEPMAVDDHPGFTELRELDRRTGRTLRTVRLAEAVSGLDVLALAGDRLLAAGAGALVAYSLRDGAVLWRRETSGGSARGLRVVGDTCLVSRDLSLDFHARADGAPLGAAHPYGPALVVTPGTRRIFVWRDERSSVELDGRGGTVRGIPGKVVAADDDHLLVRETGDGREGLVVIALGTGAPQVRLGGPKASLGEATVARGRVFYEDRARRGLYERVLATGRERLLHRTGPRVVVGGDKVGVAPGVLLAPPRILGDFLILEDQNTLFAWRVF